MRRQLLVMAMGFGLCVGCAHNKGATTQANGGTATKGAVWKQQDAELVELSMRVAELKRDVGDLNRVARQLPGKTVDEHRDRLQEGFGDLLAILPILSGPNPGGAMRTQLKTIETSRATLGMGAWDMSTDPATDDAFRATYNALSSLANEPFYASSGVRDDLDRLGFEMGEMDSVRGAFHRLVDARAMGIVSRITRDLAQTYMKNAQERQRAAAEMMASSTEPATGPAATTQAGQAQ